MEEKRDVRLPEGKQIIPPDKLAELERNQPVAVPPRPRARTDQDRQHSELDKAFLYEIKRPVIQALVLPSRGVLYGDRLPDGVVEVTPMTAREEKLFAGATGDIGELIDRILDRCVKAGSLKPRDLLVTDRMFLLLMLRANSYGDQYSFDVKCSSCSFKYKETVKIPGDLKLTELKDDAHEPFEVILPRSEKVIGFRLLRGEDEATISRYRQRALGRRAKVAKDEGDPSYSLRVALAIVMMDGIDVSDESLIQRKVELYEQMIGEDSSYLQHAMSDADSGFDLTVNTVCPNCDNDASFLMPLTAEFFRPARGGETGRA